MGTLIGLIAAIAYFYGGWRFWSGFNRTNFSEGRVHLTLLWPVFLIVSKSYRKNFTKALKGS